MIRIVHLLDDFSMGGVTRALSLFDNPRIRRKAVSRKLEIGRTVREAPHLDADLIVIHVPPCWSRLPYLGALRVKNPHARIVQVEHSYTRAFESRHVPSRARFRTLLRTAAALVDEIVSVSHAQRKWLIEVGVPPEKIATISPWCGRFELANVPPTPKPSREGPLELLAYGRFSPEKNFAALVQAMVHFAPHQVRLTLFGAGPEQEALEALAADLPNVSILPPCPDPGRYLAQCHAVIVPSHQEAFGLVATEARMAGRAVLVADVDGLPEQLRDGGGLVRPMRTVEDIAYGIRQLAQDDVVAMGTAGRYSVAHQHNTIIAGWHAIIGRAARHWPSSGVHPGIEVANAA
ncbi:glycosyltransferase family 4 protein [Alteriqipengyuania sp. 357]